MALDLRRMPRCARSSKKCTLELLKPHAPQINLFKIKRIRGWWPFRGVDQKKNEHFLAVIAIRIQFLGNAFHFRCSRVN